MQGLSLSLLHLSNSASTYFKSWDSAQDNCLKKLCCQKKSESHFSSTHKVSHDHPVSPVTAVHLSSSLPSPPCSPQAQALDLMLLWVDGLLSLLCQAKGYLHGNIETHDTFSRNSATPR